MVRAKSCLENRCYRRASCNHLSLIKKRMERSYCSAGNGLRQQGHNRGFGWQWRRCCCCSPTDAGTSLWLRGSRQCSCCGLCALRVSRLACRLRISSWLLAVPFSFGGWCPFREPQACLIFCPANQPTPGSGLAFYLDVAIATFLCCNDNIRRLP